MLRLAASLSWTAPAAAASVCLSEGCKRRNPVIAGRPWPLSSALVVGNSVRLRHFGQAAAVSPPGPSQLDCGRAGTARAGGCTSRCRAGGGARGAASAELPLSRTRFALAGIGLRSSRRLGRALRLGRGRRRGLGCACPASIAETSWAVSGSVASPGSSCSRCASAAPNASATTSRQDTRRRARGG